MLLSPSMCAYILVLDQSRTGSAALKSFLTPHGYQITMASTVKEAEKKISQRQFDIVITESNIIHSQQLQISSLLQDTQSDSYYLALIEQSNAQERVEALEAGADDCLSIPYHPKELLLKLQKLINRKHSTKKDVIKTKQFSLNVKSGDLECPWGKTLLRRKEFLIFSLLLQQKNHVVPKERLIERIWGLEETPLISTIDVHVRRIRLKIKDKQKKIIKTSYGVGYMFCDV